MKRDACVGVEGDQTNAGSTVVYSYQTCHVSHKGERLLKVSLCDASRRVHQEDDVRFRRAARSYNNTYN